MANDFQSQPNCNKCNDKGYINETGDAITWADVFICPCNCVSLEELEQEACANRLVDKIKPQQFNLPQTILNAIKLKRL